MNKIEKLWEKCYFSSTYLPNEADELLDELMKINYDRDITFFMIRFLLKDQRWPLVQLSNWKRFAKRYNDYILYTDWKSQNRDKMENHLMLLGMLPKLRYWCDENLQGRWEVDDETGTFKFGDSTDEMAFKLVWGNNYLKLRVNDV